MRIDSTLDSARKAGSRRRLQRRLAGLALALLAPFWVACSVNQDVILVLDPDGTNSLELDLPGFGLPIESQLSGGFIGQATVPLDLFAVLTGQSIQGTISVSEVVLAGTEPQFLPTGTLCNLANPDQPTDGTVAINVAQEQGSASINVHAVSFVTNPFFAGFVPPLPIDAQITQTFEVTLAQLLRIIGGGGGGLLPPSTQTITAPIPPVFFGGGTATVTVTLIEGTALPTTPTVQECVAFRDALPTHFLLGSSDASEKLPDGTNVGAGELFSWDEKDGVVEFAPHFWGHQNIDAAHLFANGDVWFSCADTCFVGNTFYKDGDIIAFNAASDAFSRLYAESALFSGDEDVDALAVSADGTILYSTETSATTRGQSLAVKDGDVVRYDPVARVHSVAYSEAQLFPGKDADVDAVSLLADGRLALSTDANLTIGSVALKDGSVFAVNPAQLPGAGGVVKLLLSEERIFQEEAELDVIGAFISRGWDPGVNSPIVTLP